MVTFTFENSGLEVVKADKEITVAGIAELKPHIIAINYLLSDKPGNDICKKLKADKLTAHIPIILYSANERLDIISRGSNADGFLGKPLELEDFVYLVHRISLS